MKLLCFTGEQTDLYRRGYPHLVVIVDDHRDDRKPGAALAKLYKDYFGAYAVHWPRAIARAFVRAIAADASLDEIDASAADRSDEITRDEALQLLRGLLAKPVREDMFKHEHWLWCVEALVGTDVVLELLAGELAALPEDRWCVARDALEAKLAAATDDQLPARLAYLAGYLLLRAALPVAQQARATLERSWRQLVDAGAELGEHQLRGGLDLGLNGREGARRVLPQSHQQYLSWWGFVDDPEMLRVRFADTAKAEWDPDPRHAWLAGPEILALQLAPRRIKGLGRRRAAFFEAVAMFNHPLVAELMSEWRDDKRVGAIATAWLAEHGVATRKAAKAQPTPPESKSKRKRSR